MLNADPRQRLTAYEVLSKWNTKLEFHDELIVYKLILLKPQQISSMQF